MDRLVTRGYARRAHGVRDRRQVLVTLTVRGGRAREGYREARRRMCGGILGALGQGEGELLVDLLVRARRALGG